MGVPHEHTYVEIVVDQASRCTPWRWTVGVLGCHAFNTDNRARNQENGAKESRDWESDDYRPQIAVCVRGHE